jgi:hypothetical protein
MAADGYVTIHRTTDAAQGELLAETLRSEGIDARFHRVSSALIGIPTLMIEMTLDVPAKSEARARELLRDLEYVGASDTAAVAGHEGEREGAGAAERERAEEAERGDAAAAADARRSRRNPYLAPGFALLLPGGAHLYARRPWTALVVAFGLVSCLGLLFISGTSLDLEVAVAIGLSLVLGDAIGSVRATRAELRGVKATRGRQLVAGFGLLGIAIVFGGGARFATANSQARRLGDYKVSCTGDAVAVENQTDEPRVIQLANLKIGADSIAGHESYDIAAVGPAVLHLAPGARGVVKASIADWLDRSCGFGFAAERAPKSGGFAVGGMETPELPAPRSLSCELRFDFFARQEGGGDGAGFDASGSCVPAQSAGQERAGRLTARR